MNNQDLLNEQIYDRTRAAELIRELAKTLGISARQLVQSLTADTVAGTVKGLFSRSSPTVTQAPQISPLVKEIRPEWFFQDGTNLEMRWENMYHQGYLVPNELFFVRNNSPTRFVTG